MYYNINIRLFSSYGNRKYMSKANCTCIVSLANKVGCPQKSYGQ